MLRAAERCIQRLGIRKTTMNDIAREARMSRPSIYRFFADREQLLYALTEQHSRALTEKTHEFLDQQDSFQDALVEGLLYLASHGNRDPFTRLLVSPDDPEFSSHIGASDTAAKLTGEFWDPLLDQAERTGQMRQDLDRKLVHIWLANVGLTLMSLKNDNSGRINLRELVRDLVVPAFIPLSTEHPTAKKRASNSSSQKAAKPRRKVNQAGAAT